MEFKLIQCPLPFAEPVNVLRIEDTVLDTGHPDDASTSILIEHLEGGDLKGVKQILVTHPHVDHAGGSKVLPQIGEMPHVILKGAERILDSFSDYLLQSREEQYKLLSQGDPVLLQMVEAVGKTYFPAERDFGLVNIVRAVESGDEIPVGNTALRAIAAPGHEENHMILFHEPSATLFSGDLIMNSAHFNRAPLTPDIAEYERSLQRVLELGPKLIVPSHGTPIANASEHLEKCLANVGKVKTRIMTTLETLTEATHLDLAKQIFNVADASKAGTLSLVVWCYLESLEEEGKIRLNRDSFAAMLQ
jgi:glyoxylase-like metal-dependent hydrolase (beta-lactamase superfamily II)